MITTRYNLYGKVSAGLPLAAQGFPCVRPHATGVGSCVLYFNMGICEPSREYKYDAHALFMRIVRPFVTGAGLLCLYFNMGCSRPSGEYKYDARAFFACCHKQITRVRVSFLFPDRIACHKLLFFRQRAVHLLKRGGRLFMGRTRPLHPAPDWTVPHGFLARLSARARAVGVLSVRALSARARAVRALSALTLPLRALSARVPIVPVLSAPGLPAPALSVSPLSVPALATRTLIVPELSASALFARTLTVPALSVPGLSASALPRRAATVVRRIRDCRRAAPEPMTAEPKT